MIDFTLTPQKSGGVAVTGYTENGVHLGAVAVMTNDPERGPVVRVPKAVTLAGLVAIVEALKPEAERMLAAKAPVDYGTVVTAEGAFEVLDPPEAAEAATEVDGDAP